MHDATPAFDTFVIDDPDDPAWPSVSRTRTEDEDMQVLVMGQYHRRLPDLSGTACGIPYHSQFCPTRRNELTGDLCGICFTDHELLNAARDAAKKMEGTR